ncbi:pyridoxal phosphate-dependent aminotransferase [Maritimibacter sp. HL-12]|uniref:pyridoxal phosphate-dependent aminotransferase n=1 Tax=Maritimibacter sp. HL-12 TaxID=1162418 RepID=UPI000A0EFBCE|nr:pyridoxal phosphate-dependent aminotransferase [Maritimibacter sp. HL-12]SMH53625.1 histidinol-phosphate aminotransferase [Maritimibacter sp. HL-12]
MTHGPRFTPLIVSLPAAVPFVGPEALERARGHPFRARLGANESVFGPSPRSVAAMREAAGETWKYGDSESFELKAALSSRLGVGPQHLTIGEGIDGLLGNLVRLTVAPGDTVVTSLGAYPTFNYHVTGFGGDLVTVPYADDREDPDALIAAARETGAKLVYIANPDNPMGTWHGAERIAAMIEALPEGTLLVLDEAYIEFAPNGTAPEIDPDDARVIRLRTFSKAHGLAGARVGYAVGAPELIAAFDKVRNHFGLSRVSQAGALAALADESWLSEVRAKVSVARGRIAEIAAACGLKPLPSATNFVALDCGGDGALARRVLAELAERDVFVRMPGVAPLDRCIRVSAGTPVMLDLFEAALPKALAAAREKQD